MSVGSFTLATTFPARSNARAFTPPVLKSYPAMRESAARESELGIRHLGGGTGETVSVLRD